QLHVILSQHDGIIAGAHMDAVGAARRDGEAELLPVGGGRVEVSYHDNGMVDSGDALDGHACTLSLRRMGRALAKPIMPAAKFDGFPPSLYHPTIAFRGSLMPSDHIRMPESL